MTFITKKHISRRALLRGAGTSVALPLLDAMIPASTALANTAAHPLPRMGYVFFPHGAVMDRFVPKATGSNFEIPQILSPAAKFKDKMTIVSGLRNKPAESSNPHGILAGTWLRGVAPDDFSDPTKGVTVDQIAARYLGNETAFPSLQLGTPSGGPCAPGVPCYFGSTVSFRTPTQALQAENNPRKMFFQLFGRGDDSSERSVIVDERASVLDSIMEETRSLNRRLGAEDNVMVSHYLESVREVEVRIQKLKAKDMTGINIPSAPVGIPDEYEEHLKVMFDLIALAYQANLSNVASFMMDKEISMRSFPNLGVAEAFHPLSHHGDAPDKLNKLASVQTFHTQTFNYFLEKLDSMPEGNGSILDNSIILYGSNMSNSDMHNQDPLPNALFGLGGGTIKGGQHLAFPQNTPHSNLLLTMLNKAGIPEESFGDSNGLLAEV